MAQWLRVSRLKVEQQELVKDFYKSKSIPIEVRHYIADWIEQNLIKNSQRLSIENFFGEMAVELMSQIHNVEMDSSTNQTINDFILNLGGYNQNNLLSTFQECLNFEKKIISSNSDDIGNGIDTVTEYLAQISQNLNFLGTNQDEMFKRQCSQTIIQTFDFIKQEMGKILVILIDDKIPEFRYKQQFLCSFLIGLGDDTENKESKKSTKSNTNCPSPNKTHSQSPHRSRNNSDQQNSFWISQSKEITDLCEKLCIRFEKTFQVLEAILGELNRASSYVTQDFTCNGFNIENYLNFTWGQMTSLISNSMIVLCQPDPVLKTTKIVKTSVCLLLGRVLNGRSNLCLKARIISVLNKNELNQYLQYKSNGTIFPQMIESNESIKGNQEKFIPKDGGLLVAQFNELKIMGIDRKEKREGESRVTDEKYCLLYNANLNVNILGKQFTFSIWTISLPISVIVSTNQYIARGSMLWDYAFREKGRLTLESPQFGSYRQLCMMLNKWFEIATGAGLKPEHFHYLLTKFSKKIDINGTQLVSYEEFCKKNLPDRGFTFFESFYYSLSITSKYLKVPWCKGSILGFCSKTQTEAIIQNSNCPPGHFIVRFSDSLLGAITFTFKKKDYTVSSCDPYTSVELSFKDFCEEINHIPELTHVYPNIPKSEAFPINLNLNRQELENPKAKKRKPLFDNFLVSRNTTVNVPQSKSHKKFRNLKSSNLHGYEARITKISGSDGSNNANIGVSLSPSSYYDTSSPSNRSQNYQFQNNSVYGLSPNYPNSNYSFSSSISQPPSPNEDPNFFLSPTNPHSNLNSNPIQIPNQMPVLLGNIFDDDYITHL